MSVACDLKRSIRTVTLTDLHRTFGGDLRSDYVHAPTPGHPPHDRGMTLRVRDDLRGVLVNCFNDDWRVVQQQVHARLGLDLQDLRPPTVAERREMLRAAAKAKAEREGRQLARVADLAMAGVRPEPGSPVRTGYLIDARGLPPAIVAQAVSAGALLEHRDTQGRVCMLALAHNWRGVLRGVQLTKLRADGSAKRGTECDRLTFGPYRGSACRLFKLSGDKLAIAEGAETAMAFTALRKLPCWATFGAANLQAFEPPRGIRTLIVAADGDAAGLDAADAIFSRLRDHIRVMIAAAPEGMDWADVLTSERRGAHVIG